MIIAIDGPAGAGKSTVAKKVAENLNFTYLDTGAMYRAFTLLVLEKNIPLDNLKEIEKLLNNFNIEYRGEKVFLNGKDVTKKIRSDEVTKNVSYISSLGFIRKKMVELQRNIGKNNNIVIEGRDIGTVVFPNADIKIYLDASVEERAKRRLKDEKDSSQGTTLEEMIEKIKKRDEYDSNRQIAPLKKANDAFYIDSTKMSIDDVCNIIIELVRKSNKNSNI